jgi:hypothetical protein
VTHRLTWLSPRMLLALTLGVHCAQPDRQTQVFLDVPVVTLEQAGDDELLRLTMAVFPEDEITYLDSAVVVLDTPAGEKTISDPEILANSFPVILTANSFEPEQVALRVPSPFLSPPAFDEHCSLSGYAAEVSLSFYSPNADKNGAAEPPLGTSVVRTPLRRTDAPTPPRVFASLGLNQGPAVNGADPTLKVLSIPPAQTRAAFATYDSAGSFNVYLADRSSLVQGLAMSFVAGEPAPAVALSDTGYYLGVTEQLTPALHVSAQDENSTEWTVAIPTDGVAPEYSALRVQGIYPTWDGAEVEAVLQSAYVLLHPDGTVLSPPAGKYYGAATLRLTRAGEVLSLEQTTRDVLAVVNHAQGSIRVTTELPPVSEGSLQIDSYDSEKSLLFSHSEPVRAAKLSIARADDALAIAYVDTFFTKVVRVLILSEGGEVLGRFSASGESPSVALLPNGNVALTFVGGSDGLPAGIGPQRAVPLLIELSRVGQVIRGQQLACGGVAQLSTLAEDTILTGLFSEFATLGETVLVTADGALGAGTVE